MSVFGLRVLGKAEYELRSPFFFPVFLTMGGQFTPLYVHHFL